MPMLALMWGWCRVSCRADDLPAPVIHECHLDLGIPMIAVQGCLLERLAVCHVNGATPFIQQSQDCCNLRS